jgi:hypothetical protein
VGPPIEDSEGGLPNGEFLDARRDMPELFSGAGPFEDDDSRRIFAEQTELEGDDKEAKERPDLPY